MPLKPPFASRAVALGGDVARGAAAGLVAALVTSLFQRAWGRLGLPPTAENSEEPPTEKLAVKLYRQATGRRLSPTNRIAAGKGIHFATGAALGTAYVLVLPRWPAVAAGRGTAYGLYIWATVEEGGLAMLGIKPPPWQVEFAEHVFAASSHVVFGSVLVRCLSAR